jgi:hypothetical protein
MAFSRPTSEMTFAEMQAEVLQHKKQMCKNMGITENQFDKKLIKHEKSYYTKKCMTEVRAK